MHLHPARSQVFDRRFQQSFFVGAVENGDSGALAAEKERRGGSAQSRSQHRNFFALVFHDLSQLERG